jgi:osmotically-inducible protein OsmY
MKSDSQLQQDVSEELKWEPSVHAGEVTVKVKNGIATLDGEVCSYAEKWSAERAALRVAGVKGITDKLTVSLTEAGARSDEDITSAVESALEWSSTVPEDAISARVDEGWVTLTGTVDWQFQRLAALDCVRFQHGVTGVSDEIVIKPALSSALVKADIEAALKRRAAADAQQISVAVSGSDVTLTGTVHSWSERELATSSAWATPGVRNVVDKLTTAY